MFKFLLLLISIIILLIGLDSSFFNQEALKKEPKRIVNIEKKNIIETSEEPIFKEVTISKKIINKVPKVKKIDKLFQIKRLMDKAQTAQKLQNFEKALSYYNLVIEQSKDSKEVKILKLYAKAQFYKANISEHYNALLIYDEVIKKFSHSSDIELLKIYSYAQFNKSYLTSGDEAIEIFDQIIENFKNIDNKEILMQLYKAQHNKAYILENDTNHKDEAIEVYDEIIKTFSPYEGEDYKTIVENALFSKSFLLMGNSDDESIEIYDSIIDKYRSKKYTENQSVPIQLEYAIVNNIELSLITNNDDTEYRELANQYLTKSPDIKPELDMLNILKNAQVSNQDENMKIWQEENREYYFSNWSFKELKQWNEQMEEGEEKQRIKLYLNKFINHSSENPDESK